MKTIPRSWPKPAFLVSLALNLLAVAAAGGVIQHKGGWSWVMRQVRLATTPTAPAGDYSETRQSVFAKLSIASSDIVMTGDSILDFGEWQELLNTPHVKNRAIAGDTTSALLRRLPGIVEGKPAHLVISCGINNLQRGYSVADAAEDYRRIVEIALTASESGHVWLLPVQPVNRTLYQQAKPKARPPARSDIAALNAALRSLAGPRVHFVELIRLSDGDELRADYTLDGLHLNGAGLVEVAKVLRSEMESCAAPAVLAVTARSFAGQP